MSLALAVRKAALAPGKWVSFPSALWRRAKAVPSHDLRFADNKSLVDAVTGQNLVTFTRASSSTYVGSDGVIRTAVTNLLLRSEEFDNASWVKVSATISADATTAPNGTTTADKLIVGNGQSAGYAVQSLSFVSGTTLTASCYAKASEASDFRFVFESAAFGSNLNAVFNLLTGVVTSFTSGSASIQSVGSGWYRCTATATTTATASVSVQFRSVHAGNGTSGIYLWGAQLEQSSTVGEYIPTTSTINSAPRFDHNPTTGESLGLLVEESRTNLLLQSNQFDTTWINSNSSETATAGIAPDGTNTAWELRDTSDASAAAHSLAQSVPFTSGNAYTFTVWMKAGTLNEGGIAIPSAAFGAVLINRINLSTGAVISTSVNSTTVVTPFGNGWYRIALTATATATASSNVQIRPMNGGTTYIGTGTGTVLLWGAQLEAGSFPTSYIPTTTATVTRSADVASITGANFSSWYRQDEGALYAAYSRQATNTVSFAASLTETLSASSLNRIQFSLNSNNVSSYALVAAGTTQGTLLPGGTAPNYVTAYSYKLDDLACSSSGNVVVTDTTAVMPTGVAYLNIGANPAGSTGFLNGTIRRLTYWPQRLSNSRLQAVTQ